MISGACHAEDSVWTSSLDMSDSIDFALFLQLDTKGLKSIREQIERSEKSCEFIWLWYWHFDIFSVLLLSQSCQSFLIFHCLFCALIRSVLPAIEFDYCTAQRWIILTSISLWHLIIELKFGMTFLDYSWFYCSWNIVITNARHHKILSNWGCLELTDREVHAFKILL